MQLKAILFDLDGTLLYTLEDLRTSTNFALTKLGYEKKTVDEIRSFVGNGVKKLIERALPNGLDNPDFEKCLNIFKQHYSENMYNKTKPYDGIPEVLKELKNNGYKLAVISNKFDSAVKELCEKYFNGIIDIAIGQKDGIEPKPSPDGINDVLSKLNISPAECIYIGDSEVDIQTAQNAGIDCISVTWGYKNIDFLYNNGASTFAYIPEDICNLV
ncbi:MAG: HAD-IIIA family hydrolase [Candidatus Gastranaerophilales bacterium]|nr:HAD-IIIA family hydrolase [Candidatus Gastranaerophilales bacterium]